MINTCDNLYSFFIFLPVYNKTELTGGLRGLTVKRTRMNLKPYKMNPLISDLMETL